MKKLVVAITAALVLALAAPVFAASGLGINGELGSKFTYDKDGVLGESYFDFNVEMKGEGGQNVKAVIELKPWSIGNTKTEIDYGVMGWDRMPLGDWSQQQGTSITSGLVIDKAYLQAEGAYWNGGPSLTTTIGDIELDQNDYVAAVDKKGVMIEGIELGPVAADTFVTFDAAGAPEYQGLSARSDLGLAEVGGTVVRIGDQGYEFSVDGSSQIAGVTVNGEYAQDLAKENAYKVRASVEPIEGITLSGGYRAATADTFAPVMHKEDLVHTNLTNEWNKVHDRKTGFDVAVETTQFGTEMKASYDDPKNEAKFEASRAFGIAGLVVEGEYTGTMSNVKDSATRALKHEIGAETTLSMIPQLQNVSLEGSVEIDGGSVSDYAGHAEYNAPNGIELGAHYTKTKGAYATAGVGVEF